MEGSTLVAVLGALVVAWAALIVVLWLVRPRGVPLRELIRAVPDILRLVRDLLTDRAAPPTVRLALAGLLIWLISPIDLIPEFLPGIGALDDVIVAVLVLRFVHRRLGADALRARWRGTAAGYELLAAVLGSRSGGNVVGGGTGRPDPG